MLSRRRFLAVAGATALGACAAPGAGPSSSPAATSTGRPTIAAVATPAPPPSASRPPDWSALAAQLRGTLVRPADAGYDAARVLYNTRFDAIRPLAIARCGSAADVQACIRFARQTGVPIVARSGGHSYGGWSTGTGLIVDVSPLRSVDVRGATATVGAGARLIDVYAAVGAAGRGIAAGSCPTVGFAGLTLGGGLGVLSRAWGLTCDQLTRIEIVTGDGTVRTCDARTEPDLFWAVRGGGGGNFGIVTSFVTATQAATPLAIGFISWPWSDAAAVVGAWQSWLATLPDAVWSNVHLDAGVGPLPTVLVHAVATEDVASLQARFDRLAAAVGSAPDTGTVLSRAYTGAMLVEGGCAQLTLAQCHLAATLPEGALGRETYVAKSAVLMAPLTGAAIGETLASLEALQGLPNAGAGSVLIDALGGAIARIAPDATAFPHRTALTTMQLLASWDPAAPQATADASTAWLRSFYSRLRPLVGNGAYVNYADPDLADWQTAYYGANYPRLQRVRATYDPDRLFAFPQSII